jgi:23S rRNA pseudouridine1911/1915/1917 synthase
MDLHILFEDYHLIAVNKPAPLLTQAPPGVPSLEALVKAYIKDKYQKPAGVYLGVPHRLDRPVSGVVLFARNTKAAHRLAVQFQNHEVRKVYWAIAEGEVQPEQGTWIDWVRKLPDQARTERSAAGEPYAKEATTDYQVLKRHDGLTFVELTPRTGRMHQLRAQAAWRGFPILGDIIYGASRSFGPPAELPRDRVIALHARSLTFTHPVRKEPITLEAPPPPHWDEWAVSR